jgi:hypothetical protein
MIGVKSASRSLRPGDGAKGLPGALGTIFMAYTGSRSGLKNAAYQDNPLPN